MAYTLDPRNVAEAVTESSKWGTGADPPQPYISIWASVDPFFLVIEDVVRPVGWLAIDLSIHLSLNMTYL